MLKNAENIALQNFPFMYTFLLQAEICTTLTPKVVQISVCNTKVYIQNWQILQGYIFRIFQHFVTKFCTFTIFDMLFSAVVLDFVFHVLMKI